MSQVGQEGAGEKNYEEDSRELLETKESAWKTT